MPKELFLVTGASGYIATHIVSQLLREGHHVRGTVRDVNDQRKVQPIRNLAKGNEERLELVNGDLLDAECWKKAVKGCTRVLHVASPLPVDLPKDEQVIIKPAVEGTLNVLRAASEEPSVKRVVFTSSGLAIFGHKPEARVYSEKDWPELDQLSAYAKSKYLAEKAAWNFVEEQRKKNGRSCFELAVIHPVFVLGPSLHDVRGTSETRFLNLLDNKLPILPNLSFATCDVRDVANAHIKAAFLPEAVGNRHIISSADTYIPMKRWAEILNEEFQSKGYTFPVEVDQSSVDIAKDTKIDRTRMTTVLGIQATEFRSTIIDMANSLLNK